jgi:putative serine protease PepD
VGVAVLALLGGAIGGGAAGYVAGGAAAGRGSGQSSVDTVPSAKSAAAAPAGSVQAVAEKTTRSVVQLKVEGRAGVGSGSGVVISDDGLIMTNNHVVEGAAEGGRITAGFSDGAQAPVTIIGRAPSADLALVKASGVRNLRPAELGRSSDLAVGQNVVAIGSPFRLSGTVTSGIISALNRPVKAGDDRESVATVLDAIQTDAAINPGNSGGPLIDMQGRVIGVNSAIYSPSSGGEAAAGSVGLGFAIPIDSARRIVKELQDKGQATQAVLGVTVGDVEQGGASVRSVTPGGAADKAGIKAGDVITAVGDRRVEGRDALVAAVRSHQPGDKVSLKVYSGGGERTVEVPLGSEVIGGR